MQIRSLALQGFKTFAQRTELGLDAGVTAVVGPNGSGKSNTVDAFKWVLGEMRAKDLRGIKMEEVIYTGGRHRAKASTAEVTIVIDNRDGRLPVDYQEVAIRRRVDRSGQSDYFLNGTRVRRRDVMELLSSTGMTTDSYAIVDQRDIDSIITSTPEQRRLLIEEAAQVRGIKAKRTEALEQLRDLAGNLSRLQDLRGEIEPRLEVVREQATEFAAAEEARRRLDLLRGSIAWEEWRGARDQHRRAQSQVQSLTRRLEEAEAAAKQAEVQWQSHKQVMEAAQDRRLRRQQAIGQARLQLSNAEHDLALSSERVRSQSELAAAMRAELGDLRSRAASAAERRDGLASSLTEAHRSLETVPGASPPPEAGDAERAKEARATADRARRELQQAEHALAGARAEQRMQAETQERLERQVLPAEAALPGLAATADAARQAERKAADASAELKGLRAEIQGLESLRPTPRGELARVGDVLIAESGFEAALAAVLGPLVDAWAAPDRSAAQAAASRSKSQTTVLYPELPGDGDPPHEAPQAPFRGGPGEMPAEPGSLLEHVRCRDGFQALGGRLLGTIVVGRDVTPEGEYRAPGLIRAGDDPRTAIAARRHRLEQRIAVLGPLAGPAVEAREAVRGAERALADARGAAGQRSRLDSALRGLERATATAAATASRLEELDRVAQAREEEAASLQRAIGEHEQRVAEHRAEAKGLELERARWRERVADLMRQVQQAERDREQAEQGLQARQRRAEAATEEAEAAERALPERRSQVESARARLVTAEQQSPEEQAELAAAARELVGSEEARVDARLKASTLRGNLDLQRRDAELAETRMEQLRERMPEGLAPEEVPGGKAREREMRQLERRLQEIGPTNALAAQECEELDARYHTLLEQLGDIDRARTDLEQLVGKLREEEETRYDAVFGAVAANFQELYGELTGGGKSTLRHHPGSDGPRSGLEILVQPPRKRMQSVHLLSSGERSLTSLALVMALQAVNPAPVTIFDEVDAALDDANVARFGEMLRRLGEERQFLVVTHNHMTMASCGVLYGVHLDESGCSHLVSVRLEDIAPARKRGQVRVQSA